MSQKHLHALIEFLGEPTPHAWLEAALEHMDILLIDHAHCEKKAAFTALHMMFRYVQYPLLLQKMSRLAREELRHFEQVLAMMQKRNIPYQHLTAARYAEQLRSHCAKTDPQRLVDILIVGAFIEARSCERFMVLAPHLDEELAGFYRGLLQSEARHYKTYIDFARSFSPTQIDDRIEFFRALESSLISSPDNQFRFHSGVPAGVVSSSAQN